MCHWMGLHFLNWIDYNGVTLLVVASYYNAGVAHFWDFLNKKILVGRDLKIGRFAGFNGSCRCFNI